MTPFTDQHVTCTDDFVFFWRGWPSQWGLTPFITNGITYTCCEQFMMAEKARVFRDDQTLQKILTATSPKIQKSLGREVQNFHQETWDGVCRGIVYSANLAKYQQNPDLAAKLLATGNRLLVEASPVDQIWGIGLAVDHPDILIPAKWPGKNWLGIALTQVRSTLRGEPLPDDLQTQLNARRAILR